MRPTKSTLLFYTNIMELHSLMKMVILTMIPNPTPVPILPPPTLLILAVAQSPTAIRPQTLMTVPVLTQMVIQPVDPMVMMGLTRVEVVKQR